MVTREEDQFYRSIHDIENTYFRTKFCDELAKFKGNLGIGVISDTDAQPIVVNSHLGHFAIVTVGKINNLDELVQHCLENRQQFTELSGGKTNPTELVALLITQGKDFVEGIQNVYQMVKGSISMLILTKDGIIAARDFYGRTPIVIGKDEEGYAVAFESHSYVNFGYTMDSRLRTTKGSMWRRCAIREDRRLALPTTWTQTISRQSRTRASAWLWAIPTANSCLIKEVW